MEPHRATLVWLFAHVVEGKLARCCASMADVERLGINFEVYESSPFLQYFTAYDTTQLVQLCTHLRPVGNDCGSWALVKWLMSWLELLYGVGVGLILTTNDLGLIAFRGKVYRKMSFGEFPRDRPSGR